MRVQINYYLFLILLSSHSAITYINIYMDKFIAILQGSNTISVVSRKKQLSQTFHSTPTMDVESTIRGKIKTFTSFNYKSQLSQRKKKIKEASSPFRQKSQTSNVFKSLIASLVQKTRENQKKKQLRKKTKGQELEGIKTERRERFKRMQNPLHIIQYYISKQGYTPNQEQNMLLGRIIDLKEKIESIQPFNLELALHHIYKTMNITVDLNSMKFLILTIMMAGQICYEVKQVKGSFYFYSQSLTAGTCTRMPLVKMESLFYLGKICMEALQYSKAIIFFKKSLQYAWKTKDNETQLKIYDWLGQCYYYQGQAQTALYYHNRYILGENEHRQSAVRRISSEMLAEYEKTIENTQLKNLSKLFISYLRLPIGNFQYCQPTIKKVYQNYENNESPRKNIQNKIVQISELPDISVQIDSLLKGSSQFQTEIPSPDLHRNFVAIPKFGRPRKNIEFEQSNDFHKIIGVKVEEIDRSVLKLPIEEEISRLISQKPNASWWQDIKVKSKKQRMNKLGSIRNKVQRTHMSYQKYPEQRKKMQSLKAQKINQSLNKTILNWIDPPKKGIQ